MKLNIALIGTRGIPANYGGFETCVEELGKRLVQKGHRVTVYCRSNFHEELPAYYFGMKRVVLPCLKTKSLETPSHTFLSVCHALRERFDVYMMFNTANAPLIPPLWIFSKKTALNTDGLEWQRSKWGPLGKLYYRLSEKLAAMFANRLVTDSVGIQDYYRTKHHTDSSQIAYGAVVQPAGTCNHIEKMGLQSGTYFLQITRFEPENHPLLTIEAFKRIKTDKKLVLVGGNPYPSPYVNEIAAHASETIYLPGFIYNAELLAELWRHCFAYIHGNSVGGTNPALLQAMAAGCYTIAYDVSFNRDVLSNCGAYYKKSAADLAAQMEAAIEKSDHLETFRQMSMQRILTHYSWDTIADQYENLFFQLVSNQYPWRLNWRAFS